MKILVAGAAGQLGTDLVRLGGDDGHEMIGLDQRPLEIASADAINTAVGAHAPDLVVNCAAWTAMDLCEDDPDRAELLNGTAFRYLAGAPEQHGAHLVEGRHVHVPGQTFNAGSITELELTRSR